MKWQTCPVPSRLSSAAADCAGSLARLHPAAFASRMVPRLKDEIFAGSRESRKKNSRVGEMASGLMNNGCFSAEPAAEGDASTVPRSGCRAAARERSVTALASVSSGLGLVQESAPVLLQVLTAAHKGTHSQLGTQAMKSVSRLVLVISRLIAQLGQAAGA